MYINIKSTSNYERYIRARAAVCGYCTTKDLAQVLGIASATLNSRLRGDSHWSVRECNALYDALQLEFVDWILLSLFRSSPFDSEYKVMRKYITNYLRVANAH